MIILHHEQLIDLVILDTSFNISAAKLILIILQISCKLKDGNRQLVSECN